MAPNPVPKKRSCVICDTEHEVGEECPNCGWHQEKEEAKVRAESERERMREEAKKPKRKKGLLDFSS